MSFKTFFEWGSLSLTRRGKINGEQRRLGGLGYRLYAMYRRPEWLSSTISEGLLSYETHRRPPAGLSFLLTGKPPVIPSGPMSTPTVPPELSEEPPPKLALFLLAILMSGCSGMLAPNAVTEEVKAEAVASSAVSGASTESLRAFSAQGVAKPSREQMAARFYKFQ